MIFTHASTRQVNLGGCSNNIGLVDTSQGDTIDLVGTGNQQEARLESLDADDTLTTKTSSQKNEDGTRGDGRADSGSLSGLAGLLASPVAAALAVALGALSRLVIERAGTLSATTHTVRQASSARCDRSGAPSRVDQGPLGVRDPAD